MADPRNGGPNSLKLRVTGAYKDIYPPTPAPVVANNIRFCLGASV